MPPSVPDGRTATRRPGPRSSGHLQSLLLGGVLVVIGVQSFLIALLADLVAINRKLLEELTLHESSPLSAFGSAPGTGEREGAVRADR